MTALVLGDFAGLLRNAGRQKEGEVHLLEALKIGRRIMPNHPLLIRVLNDYGDELDNVNRLDDAQSI